MAGHTNGNSIKCQDQHLTWMRKYKTVMEMIMMLFPPDYLLLHRSCPAAEPSEAGETLASVSRVSRPLSRHQHPDQTPDSRLQMRVLSCMDTIF